MYPTLDTIDLAVTDLAAAIKFYRGLGLEFVRDKYVPDNHAACDLPNGIHLMLDTDPFRAKMTEHWTPPRLSRAFLAFQFDSPAAVDAKYAELTKAGAEELQEPFDVPWGMRYATVADPFGQRRRPVRQPDHAVRLSDPRHPRSRTPPASESRLHSRSTRTHRARSHPSWGVFGADSRRSPDSTGHSRTNENSP